MNQLLGNRVGKKPRTQRKGCLFLILGSLAALLATGVYVLAVTFLARMIGERHAGEAGYAVMTILKGSYTVALFLFYAILALWYVSPSQAEVDKQNRQFATMPGGHNQEPAKAMPRSTLWLITGGLLLCVVLTGLFSLNTYDLITEDGIRTYCFVETGRHDWDDISAYSVDCDTNTGLTVTFRFKDGAQFEILRGNDVNSATADFKETYTSTTHFAAELDKRLLHPEDDRPVPPRNMSSIAYDRAVKFYRGDGRYEILWPYVSQLIGYVEMDILPDETAPETQAPAETVSETTPET